jgi:hypothetical protein
MSKASKIKVPKEMTRKHLRRAEREARQQRWLLIGVGAAVLVALALIGYAFLDERVIKVQQPVATINGKNISVADFQKRVKYTRQQLSSQLNQLDAQRAQFGSDPSLSFITDQIDQQINSLQSQLASPTALGKNVLDTMVEEELVRQEAAKRNISASADEVQTDIEHSFDYYRVPPTATPAPTASPTPLASPTPQPTATVSITPTATPEPTWTPQPTATPVTEQAFKTAFDNFINQIAATGMTRQDISKIVEFQLLRRKLQEAFNQDVPASGEQIQFRYIAFENQAQAAEATAQIKSPADFDAYYAKVDAGEVTSATASAEAWMPVDEVAQNFAPNVAEVLLSLGISQTSQLITNTVGTGGLLIQQTGRGVQPFAPSQLQTRQSQVYRDWLNAQRMGAGVNLYNNRYAERLPK